MLSCHVHWLENHASTSLSSLLSAAHVTSHHFCYKVCTVVSKIGHMNTRTCSFADLSLSHCHCVEFMATGPKASHFVSAVLLMA
jgi:hypothetical protein